jgi:hypothetical protein
LRNRRARRRRKSGEYAVQPREEPRRKRKARAWTIPSISSFQPTETNRSRKPRSIHSTSREKRSQNKAASKDRIPAAAHLVETI